ncbi:MAG: GNAT family N-acetyltransferase [Phycisphaerales bacterium]|nr:GNAT family N-acetyltransferase [Phycisphaerales bacterium]
MIPGLRDARDEDAHALQALIRACYDEYENCVLDAEREEPLLVAPASGIARLNGRFWVVDAGRDDGSTSSEAAHEIIACVACAPSKHESRVLELKKLYVARPARRRGLGAALVNAVEREAISRGCRAVELWSDTRFLDAHRMYERLGYARTGAIRELFDLSETVEYQYVKKVNESESR